MTKFFTHDIITGKHHKFPEDGIWTHFDTSCNVHDLDEVKSDSNYYVPDNSEYVTRLFRSKVGIGIIFYELKGKLTFVAPISSTRIAWQRLDWNVNYLSRWDNDQIQNLIKNFLWVADCEEAKSWLKKD